jgi:hypothetical protein
VPREGLEPRRYGRNILKILSKVKLLFQGLYSISAELDFRKVRQ